jgi:hypothetical protein
MAETGEITTIMLTDEELEPPGNCSSSDFWAGSKSGLNRQTVFPGHIA